MLAKLAVTNEELIVNFSQRRQMMYIYYDGAVYKYTKEQALCLLSRSWLDIYPNDPDANYFCVITDRNMEYLKEAICYNFNRQHSIN